jgi:hypothetical protein
MRTSTKCSAATALSFLVVAGTLARAADPSLEAQARAHFERGQTLSSEGRYEGAHAEFSAGYDLSHKPLFLFNMGECARLAGDAEQAARDYERYLAEDPQGRLAEKAQERVAELRSRLPQPPTVPSPAEPTPPTQKPAPAPIARQVTDSPVLLTQPVPPSARHTRPWVIAVAVSGALVVAGGVVALGVTLGSREVGPPNSLGHIAGNGP